MKIITNTIFIISLLLSIYYLYLHIIPFEFSKIGIGILAIVFLTMPMILESFLKLKIEKYIKLIYYFFLLFSFILGGLFALYYKTLYFDLLVHFLFGFLLSIIIGTKIKTNSLKKGLLLLMIVLFIGFLWETLEFLADVFMKSDHQEKMSGAVDTMSDLLISLLGSIFYFIGFKIMNKIK